MFQSEQANSDQTVLMRSIPGYYHW